MSQGFLIFAHNNSKIDYTTLALCTALAIKKNLRHKSVTLVTNDESWAALTATHGELANTFDHVVIEPQGEPMERRFYDGVASHVLDWFNGSRHRAYDISPYDETILLDADFIIQDGWLDLAFGSDNPVMMNHEATALDHHPMAATDVRLDSMSIPIYWATVVYFRKCSEAAYFFRLVADVRKNYVAYRQLYDFNYGPYRNDFVFSIAAHMWSGFVENNFPNLPMASCLVSLTSDELIEVGDNKLLFLVHDRPARVHHLTKVSGISLHCMNKFSLLRHAADFIRRDA